MVMANALDGGDDHSARIINGGPVDAALMSGARRVIEREP
jgi:hypothetical protein